MFWKHLQESYLDIFGQTIHTIFNRQPYHLKKDLVDSMVGLFGDIFNQSQVKIITGKYLKMIRDTYRVNIEKTLGMIDLMWFLRESEGSPRGRKGKMYEKTRKDTSIWRKI